MKKDLVSSKDINNAKKIYKKSSKGGKVAIVTLSILFIVAALAVATYIYYPTIKDIISDNENKDQNDNKDDNSNNNDNKDNNDDKKDDESNKSELGELNIASSVSWNSTFSLTSGSIFYQYSKESINDYYSSIDFSDDKVELTSSLFNLLKKDFKKLDYTGKNSSLNMSTTWANYVLVDRDYDASPLTEEEVSKNKWTFNCEIDLLYSSKNIDLSTSKGLGNYADREHIYPKSYGFNTSGTEDYKQLNAGCDLHNLWAADKAGNQTSHNNRLYDDIKDNSDAIKVTDRIDGTTSTYYNDSYFEPNDEDKGIIARSCLYMYLRYNEYYIDENNIENPKLILNDEAIRISGSYSPLYTKDNDVSYGKLSTLLKWNNEHPVSEHEKTRNNLVYNLQGNRNPFIDYPNLANILFK